MVYLNKEMGQAIGLLIKEAQTPSEVVLTSDSLVIRLGMPAPIEATVCTTTKRKRRGKIEFDGLCLTVQEWAERLGVKKNVIKYRMKKFGTPFGKEKPTDEDVITVASAEV